MVLIYIAPDKSNMAVIPNSRAKSIASAAICAALFAAVNAATSFAPTPFGVGEFRPGVVIPAFFALVAGPLPAAVGAAVGSFIGDMVSLVPTGRSTFILALAAGGSGNFLGFLVLGWIYEKLRSWRGFVIGTTAGLFVGNFVAAAVVVLILSLSAPILSGLLLFWFGTMFPFVIIIVPVLLRFLRPYASQFSVGRPYPEMIEPNRKVVWTWSIVVALLVVAALLVALLTQSGYIAQTGGSLAWESLFVVSAIAVIAIGAFLPRLFPQEPPAVSQTV